MDSKSLVIARIEGKLKMNAISLKYIAPGCLIAGAALGAWVIANSQNNPASSGTNWGMVLVMILVFSGIGILFSALKTRNDGRILTYAQSQPEKIVWIYHQIVKVNGVPQENMTLGDDTRKIYRLPIRRVKGQNDPMMDALVETFPHAVVGFSYDLQKAFKRNPQEFRNLNKHNN
jgi:hypothetical protein